MHSSHANGDTFLEGTVVTFTCSSGLVLSGPNSSICMRNGEWEPSPKELECKGAHRKLLCSHMLKPRNNNVSQIDLVAVSCGLPPEKSGLMLAFNSTLEGSQLMFWCDESPNDTKIASCLEDGRWSVDLEEHSCTCTTEGKPCIF